MKVYFRLCFSGVYVQFRLAQIIIYSPKNLKYLASPVLTKHFTPTVCLVSLPRMLDCTAGRKTWVLLDTQSAHLSKDIHSDY